LNLRIFSEQNTRVWTVLRQLRAQRVLGGTLFLAAGEHFPFSRVMGSVGVTHTVRDEGHGPATEDFRAISRRARVCGIACEPESEFASEAKPGGRTCRQSSARAPHTPGLEPGESRRGHGSHLSAGAEI